MFVPNFKRCPLPLKLISFVLNVLKSCTLCPLGLTQLILSVKKVMCKAHEGIFDILSFEGLGCK
ncbi:hypothetical protein Hanom_Chr09g00788641 [Helianthus anomalus]